MNYAESIEYLYNLGYELSVKKFGLENTLKLLERLENPEKNYLKIQIAGTNGKGSTCAFLESICVSAKIKVGKFTSPHLVSITERISINGVEISERKFAEYATIIRAASENLVESCELGSLPTFFEQVTAIALCAFAEENVETAILETGLGGRFDATTAAKAEIIAFTPIDYDHQNILGNTLAEIASEKAAIIRKDTQVILAKQPEEAADIVLRHCANFGITPKLTVDLAANFKSQISNFKTEKAKYENVQLSLRGKHQIENAKVAILLAETLSENGFTISEGNIIEGLKTAKHKGRLEFYKNFLFDGAHNISGAKALRKFLNENNEKGIIMVFGAMKEKDLSEIGAILFPIAEKLILTKPENPRSAEVEELAKSVPQKFRKENLYFSKNVADAINTAQQFATENDIILVTGSLYLVGETIKLLKI